MQSKACHDNSTPALAQACAYVHTVMADKAEREGMQVGIKVDTSLWYTANTQIAKGEQIFTPYGFNKALSNAQILMDYGFVIPSNPEDSCLIHVPAFLNNDALSKRKFQLLERYDLGSGDYPIFKDEPPYPLILVSRVKHLVEKDFQRAVDVTRPLPRARERAALLYVKELLQNERKRYSTSIQQDGDALPDATGRRATAVAIRLSEKLILLNNLRYIEEQISLLN
jgi:hypothetical protein